MKTALLIGCGSKFGLEVLKKLLDDGYKVNSISGSVLDIQHDNLNHLVINWKSFSILDIAEFLGALPKLDFVLFNQNSSSLSTESFNLNTNNSELWKHEIQWAQSYFTSCILPYHIIQTLGNRCHTDTRVMWMLSTLIYEHSQKDIGFADYIGNKYQNYVIMKNFSSEHPACFFGIDPGELSESTYINRQWLISNVLSYNINDLNGSIRTIDLMENKNFNRFETTKDSIISKQSSGNVDEVASEICPVKFSFNISQAHNKSMSLTIGDRIFDSLSPGEFIYKTNISFPSTLRLIVAGKNNLDTIIENNMIVEDKSIVLTGISIYDIEVDINYLEQCIILHTDSEETIYSNYFGFNGYVDLEFNATTAFNWLLQTKKQLD